jgi:DDE family transposase
VVTNLPQSPRRVYAIYRERGDVENRLKKRHYGLGFDRTSCTAFWANAFRVLLTAVAYVLLQRAIFLFDDDRAPCRVYDMV